VRRDVERSLVGADRVDRVRDDAARQRVAPFERLELAAPLELVRARRDHVHRTAEALAEHPGGAVVVAATQQHVLGRPVLGEPLDPLARQHRVDHDALGLEVVRAHVVADPLAERRPVPKSGGELLHDSTLPLREGEHT
jgi:hypothetical protein